MGCEIKKEDLAKVNGGDMTVHQLNILNQVMEVVSAKLDAYFGGRSSVTYEEKYKKAIEFYDEACASFSGEDKAFLDSVKTFIFSSVEFSF